MNTLRLIAGIVIVFAVATPALLRAQSPEEFQALKSAFRALEDRTAALERELAERRANDEKPAGAAAPTSPGPVVGSRGNVPGQGSPGGPTGQGATGATGPNAPEGGGTPTGRDWTALIKIPSG